MLRLVTSRPRLFTAMAAVPAAYLLLPSTHAWSTRLLAAWDLAVAGYLLAVLWMMLRARAEAVAKRAAEQDVGQRAVVVFAVLAALLSFAAIAVEMKSIRHAAGFGQVLRIALILCTILLSWSFVQVIFSLRYAHIYHRGRNGRGLGFPGPAREPDYVDFLYVSFTIGSAFATSDVNVTAPDMRRAVLLHTIISFLFNSMILALSINVGASLL